jgi:hypothetical protein
MSIGLPSIRTAPGRLLQPQRNLDVDRSVTVLTMRRHKSLQARMLTIAFGKLSLFFDGSHSTLDKARVVIRLLPVKKQFNRRIIK